MNLVRKAGLAAVLVLTLIWLGCGDVFRPVASPILRPGGDPATAHFAVVVNNNNGEVASVTQVDVSGDSNVANYPVGQGPVHATFNPFQSQVYIANFAGDSISFYGFGAFATSPPSLVTPAGTPARTISLPAGSKPVFLVMTTSQALYVANSGSNTVGVISTLVNALTASVPVGPNPVALAETPGGSKVYCVNKGNGTVTVISTANNTVAGTISVGAAPVWASMNPDGKTVYVLNQGSGTVSVISTETDTVTGTLAVGTAPNFLFLDSHLNRLYVTNTGSDNVSVFDLSSGSPVPLATVAVGKAPACLTALSDGSRVYVANSGDNNVAVIDAVNLTIKHAPIAVGTTPVWIASSSDATRVFVANRDSDSVSDIRTADDTVVLNPSLTNATIATASPRPVFVLVSQ